ncbi:DUF4224 domain-containing protein [Neisseria leonii]|uniref:DUF4224 domain-containing protein n=1 Tax=Neisseria leonii TaxID=2995413 RepID=A0A9X4E2Y0_9NEIS|nr:DUF4224 domain-containing protein [Neisseria sp. 51.81]MDD9328244.1 DUF4224 domain-containing protein [Neisseria sp. 51.81]
MDSIFLTDAELAELTGYCQPKKQAEHLRKLGIPFLPNARGVPKVTRSAIEGRTAGKAGKAEPVRKKWQPAVLNTG